MIRDLPMEDRPMEKLQSLGVKALSDSELLCNIIRTGTREKSALQLSHQLINECGGLEQLSAMSVTELRGLEGIGVTKACKILAAFELGRRAKGPKSPVGQRINSPTDIVDFFQHELADESVEKFVIVNLSTSNAVIDWEAVSVGILNASLVHPREIFRCAMKSCASSIIAVHNHPSGNPNPSKEDFMITRRLREAGSIVGINLMDHIIVAGGSYYSFKENNHLDS